jgi:hypothetical protein
VFRRHTRLDLDSFLYYLRRRFPSLRRSTLYRCFVRYHVNRIPKERNYPRTADQSQPKRFEIQVHVLAKGHLYTAISEFYSVFAQCFANADTAIEFLKRLIVAASFAVNAVVTSDHWAFTNVTLAWDPTQPDVEHPFHEECKKQVIAHYVRKVRKNTSLTFKKGWRAT